MNIYEDQKNKEKYCKTTNLVGKFFIVFNFGTQINYEHYEPFVWER